MLRPRNTLTNSHRWGKPIIPTQTSSDYFVLDISLLQLSLPLDQVLPSRPTVTESQLSKTRTTDDSYSDSLHISLTYIAYIASLLNDQSPSATAPPHRDEVAPHWPTVAAITQPFSGTRSLTVEINWKRRQLKSRPLPPVLKKVGGTVEGWTICHTTSTEDVFWRVIKFGSREILIVGSSPHLLRYFKDSKSVANY